MASPFDLTGHVALVQVGTGASGSAWPGRWRRPGRTWPCGAGTRPRTAPPRPSCRRWAAVGGWWPFAATCRRRRRSRRRSQPPSSRWAGWTRASPTRHRGRGALRGHDPGRVAAGAAGELGGGLPDPAGRRPAHGGPGRRPGTDRRPARRRQAPAATARSSAKSPRFPSQGAPDRQRGSRAFSARTCFTVEPAEAVAADDLLPYLNRHVERS